MSPWQIHKTPCESPRALVMSSLPPAPALREYSSSSAYNSVVTTGSKDQITITPGSIPAPLVVKTSHHHIAIPSTKEIPQPRERPQAPTRSYRSGQRNGRGHSFQADVPQLAMEPLARAQKWVAQPALPTPPQTPDIGRLPTPDIDPWDEHPFCPCCSMGDKDALVAKARHAKRWDEKAKMDAQLQAAMEYIRRRRAE